MTASPSTLAGVDAEPPKPPDTGGLSLRRISFLAGAGSFLDGFDLLIINAALLSIVPDFDLSDRETGLLTSLPFVGMVVGALVAGRLCDRFGRRRIYLLDVVAFLVIVVLLAVAQDYWQLLALRLLLGVAIGMDMPTGSSMLAEFAPRGRVGQLAATMQTVWVSGGLVASVVGLVLFRVAGPSSWRWMFAAAAVPAVVIAVMRHSLPESPRWRSSGGLEERSSRRSGNLRTLFGNRTFRRAVAFFTAYWVIESFLGGPPFIYTALIFSRVVDLSPTRSLVLSAALSAVYVVGNVVGQYVLLDRFGRKPVAIVVCGVTAVAAVATGLLEHSGLPLVLAFGVFAVGTQMAPLPFWPWSVEQLPTRVRATGQSFGSAGGKLGQFIGLNVFTTGTIASFGWAPYFAGVVGGGFLVLVLLVAVVGRETKGADLDALDAA